MTSTEERPSSLSEAAYLALREGIVTGRLQPGQFLTERQVAADLDLGLTPVRQALARLGTEGLVRTLPRKGYQVVPLTIQSVNELFQVWRILGPPIAEIALGSVPDDAWRAKMAECRERFARVLEEGDGNGLVDEAYELWLWIVQSTGNSRLVEMFARLADELRRVFLLVFRDPFAPSTLSLQEEAWTLWAGDAARFRKGIEDFIDNAHRHVLGVLTSWPSVAQAEAIPPGAPAFY